MLNKFVKVTAVAVLAVSAGIVSQAQTVKGSIVLPGVPEGIGVNYLNNRIYVAVPNFNNVSDSLTIIDGKTDTVIKTVSIPPVGQSVAVDVVRDMVYIAGTYFDVNGVEQSKVAVYDVCKGKVTKVIPITTTPGAGLEGIAVNPLNGVVYVSNASDNVIDVIYGGSYQVAGMVPVGESPFGVTVNPFKREVYVALSNGTVDVIDPKSNTVKTTAVVGDANAGIAVNYLTGNVFVTNNDYGTSTVGILDQKGNVLSTVGVGNTPFGVDVDFITNMAFVANTQDGTVSIIDGKTNTVTGFLPVTGLYVAANPATAKVYVGGQDNSITVISEK